MFSITNNIPKAEGLTAIEGFIIVCIVFVFGALIGEWSNIYQNKNIYFFKSQNKNFNENSIFLDYRRIKSVKVVKDYKMRK